LLNIEGLGRQLYPDLDLWQTAHPFLERWLKNRFHPKSLWKELKRYAPEWMEKFPQVPQLIFNGLQQLPAIQTELQLLRDAQLRQAKQDQRLQWVQLALVALIGLGAGFFMTQWL
jgi:ubiquinone biosynthesis protein